MDKLFEQALVHKDVAFIIEKYNLKPHIEGGYYYEDFKSEIIVPIETANDKKNRTLLTTCYYLLTNRDRSIFHKLKSDELWHFYCGGPVDLFTIDQKGNLSVTVLGPDMHKGHVFKHLIRPDTWFGALPQKETPYAFFGCSVFPGFEFCDWQPGDRVFLKNLCPSLSDVIDLLT